MRRIALSILAHPDDAEFVCAGTLALLAQKGWQIHIATASPGNCGSAVTGPDEIAAIRRKEGAAAAEIISGQFHCLESEDCFIRHDKPTMHKAIELIRNINGVSVLAHPYTLKNQDFIPQLVDWGLRGLEVYYPEHSQSQTVYYENLAKKYNLLITGGSDYHGEIKPKVDLGSVKVPYDLVEKLKEEKIKDKS